MRCIGIDSTIVSVCFLRLRPPLPGDKSKCEGSCSGSRFFVRLEGVRDHDTFYLVLTASKTEELSTKETTEIVSKTTVRHRVFGLRGPTFMQDYKQA